jgi:glycosyltransferase involved in cell wall biosynthesis
LLITMHCCLDEILRDQIERMRKSLPVLLNSAGWVTGVSMAALESVRRIAPSIEPRSSVLANGLEPPPVAPADLPFDPPCVLCLGRLDAIKGFDLAIDALGRLGDRFPGLKLLIAGDGTARPALEHQAAGLGLAGRVEFLGMLDSAAIWDTINRATLVVMPSRTEGFPLVALEAMLMARPIVASRAGGLPEAVVDGETGLLVDIKDVEGLAGAIASLLAGRDRARRMGTAGRVRAIEKFSWQRNVVEPYESLYRRLIAARTDEC